MKQSARHEPQDVRLPTRSMFLMTAAICFPLFLGACKSSSQQNAAAANQSGSGAPATFEAKLQACEGGDLARCSEVGAAYAKGEGVKQDAAQGLKYSRKACDGNVPQACFQAGMVQLMGPPDLRDAVMGVASLVRACDGKHGEACAFLGTMSAGLIKMEGLNPNPELAKSYYKKACDYGHQQSCALAK